MPNIGPLELTIVVVIALLVLAPRRLPEAGRSLGQAIRGFRQSLAGADRDHAGFDGAGAHPPSGDDATARRRESDADSPSAGRPVGVVTTG